MLELAQLPSCPIVDKISVIRSITELNMRTIGNGTYLSSCNKPLTSITCIGYCPLVDNISVIRSITELNVEP